MPFQGVFFKSILPLSPTLVELQRCKSNRIQSFWQKSVLSAFPLEFLGHSVVSRGISPSGHCLPRRCCHRDGSNCWGDREAQGTWSCHCCRLCAVCATASQVNRCCCWVGCPGIPHGLRSKQAALSWRRWSWVGDLQRGSAPWQPVPAASLVWVRIRAPSACHTSPTCLGGSRG